MPNWPAHAVAASCSSARRAAIHASRSAVSSLRSASQQSRQERVASQRA
ncbi:hypothetical protein [Kitasatospora sp. NPDC059327]